MITKSPTIWQLWRIAAFLMLSSLSAMAMTFVDRLMLATYSLEAHNVAIEASNFGWAFQGGWSSLAGITQVFVSQYHGAGQKHLLSRPVWQMVWLSLFSFIAFLPLAFLFPKLLYQSEMKQDYLFWILLCVPFQGIFAALCGFFIGQQQVSLTVKAVFLGNVINFLLAYLLIFGIHDLLPPFGATGAIIATDIALISQLCMLVPHFLKHSFQNRTTGLLHYGLDIKLMIKCLRIGFPNALFGVLEALGWSLFYTMMASMGFVHLTVAGIVQNVLILTYFFGDGLRRAVATLCGNAIGAQRKEDVLPIVKSALILMTLFCAALALFLWLTRSVMSEWFLSDLSPDQRAHIFPALLFGLANAVIYKYLEGIRLSIGGALTAAADTKFLLVCGSASVWIFMVLPQYLLTKNNGSIEQALMICTFYTLATALIFMWRFYRGKWMDQANVCM